MTERPVILVCPLDWGLGHASRLVPVIHHLLQKKFKLILGGSGESLELLSGTFPHLPRLKLPSTRIRYSKGRSQVFVLAAQIPHLIFTLWKEHRLIKKYVRQFFVDYVISDNRYGLYCKGAHTVFITHQIFPALPRFLSLLEVPLYRYLKWMISRFDQCWVPDIADPVRNFSGKLSHCSALPNHGKFIGILSRFNAGIPETTSTIPQYDLVVVLSGPEPQKSIFFNKIIDQLEPLSLNTLIMGGLTNPVRTLPESDKIVYKKHLPDHEFARALMNAEVIICRSGYSSIMDLAALGKPAILVPTPGQSEQEYLAAFHSKNGAFMVVKQHELDLQKAVNEFRLRTFTPVPFNTATDLNRIPELI